MFLIQFLFFVPCAILFFIKTICRAYVLLFIKLFYIYLWSLMAAIFKLKYILNSPLNATMSCDFVAFNVQ